MNISSLGKTSSYEMYRLLSKLSSGRRINSAADDAAGLAISQNMRSQSTSYETQNRNITDSKSFLDTAGGALSSVTDSLQRMKELAMQSSNGIYSDSDKQAMQAEVDQLKQQIDSVGQGTMFNGIPALNGSVSLSGATQDFAHQISAESLGISDLDITGDFDMGSLDRALDTVSGIQGEAGSSGNLMSHTMNFNSTADINIQSAQSMIEDADMARAVMELKQKLLVQKSGQFVQHNVMNLMKESGGSLLNLRV